MPTQKIVTLYTYDELDAKAQETAREWFTQADTFSDYVSYDDFIEICERVGVTIGTVPRKGRNDNTYQEPQIHWSGFWSQGDGASFAGAFKSTGTAGAMIRDHAPQDEKLHAIGDAIDAITANYPHGVTAEITRPYHSNYYHEMTMEVDAMTTDDAGEEVNLSESDDKALKEAIRDLARWFYDNLEEEYNYRNSDEEVAESIRINEYTFTADGKRED